MLHAGRWRIFLLFPVPSARPCRCADADARDESTLRVFGWLNCTSSCVSPLTLSWRLCRAVGHPSSSGSFRLPKPRICSFASSACWLAAMRGFGPGREIAVCLTLPSQPYAQRAERSMPANLHHSSHGRWQTRHRAEQRRPHNDDDGIRTAAGFPVASCQLPPLVYISLNGQLLSAWARQILSYVAALPSAPVTTNAVRCQESAVELWLSRLVMPNYPWMRSCSPAHGHTDAVQRRTLLSQVYEEANCEPCPPAFSRQFSASGKRPEINGHAHTDTHTDHLA